MEFITEDFIDKQYDKLFDKSRKYSVKFCTKEGRQKVADVLNKGEFSFGLPKVSYIPKKSGNGLRRLLINPTEDRLLMNIIYAYLVEEYRDLIHPACVSYLPKLSVPNIVKEISKTGHVKGVKLDIEGFFDNVPIDIINIYLTDFIEPFIEPVREYYNTNKVIEDGKEIECYKSLAQGCAISAFLADAILYGLDEDLSNLDVVYCRYCDDMIFLSENDEELNKAIEVAKEGLANFGLRIKESKTEWFDGEVTFLGALIKENEVSLSKENFKHLYKEIKKVINRKTSKLDVKIRRVQRYLLGVDADGRSVMDYYFNLCTCLDNFKRLDKLIRQEIKASLTGRHNHTHNNNKYPDSLLFELGWVNLTFLYNVYKSDFEVYKAYCKKIIAGKIVHTEKPKPINQEELIDKINEYYSHNFSLPRFDLCNGLVAFDKEIYKVVKESISIDDFKNAAGVLWNHAKYYESKKSPLNVKGGDTYISYGIVFSRYVSLITFILSHKIPIDGRYIKIDDLVIFKEWVT